MPRRRAILRTSTFAPPAGNPTDNTQAVSLEIVARSPGGDAANIIGGIADVLEDKPIRSHWSAIDHLGELALVWLYRDDNQIKQITHREEPGESSYTVTVRAL